MESHTPQKRRVGKVAESMTSRMPRSAGTGTLRAHFAGVHGITLSDDAIEKKYPQDEWNLRKLWTSNGVPVEKQDRLIAEIDAKAQPGAHVGPWVINE